MNVFIGLQICCFVSWVVLHAQRRFSFARIYPRTRLFFRFPSSLCFSVSYFWEELEAIKPALGIRAVGARVPSCTGCPEWHVCTHVCSLQSKTFEWFSYNIWKWQLHCIRISSDFLELHDKQESTITARKNALFNPDTESEIKAIPGNLIPKKKRKVSSLP